VGLYILVVIIIIGISLIIGIKQKVRGLKFWPSFFISLIAVTGISGLIWKMLF